MHICKQMLTQIPAPVAQIEATNEGMVIIDDDKLLVMSPVKCHVACIFENIVIWVTQDMDIAVSLLTFRTQVVQGMLGVSRIAGQCLRYFLVHDDIDLDTSFCGSFQTLIESPFLVEKWRSSQKQFWRQPPVFDVDGLFRTFQSDRDSPEIVPAIYIPLDFVVVALREEGIKAMGITDRGSLTVCFLLMLLVMAVIWIDDILKLPDFVF